MILASFPGRCPLCGNHYEEGTPLSKTEWGWAHAEGCPPPEFVAETPDEIMKACEGFRFP